VGEWRKDERKVNMDKGRERKDKKEEKTSKF
jgi:hypothetical protein